MLVPETRARQDHCGETRIREVDRDTGRDQLGAPRLEHQRRVRAGTQVDARPNLQWRRRASGNSRADARVEHPDLQHGGCASRRFRRCARCLARTRGPLPVPLGDELDNPRASCDFGARASSCAAVRPQHEQRVVILSKTSRRRPRWRRSCPALLHQLVARVLLDVLGFGRKAHHERPVAALRPLTRGCRAPFTRSSCSVSPVFLIFCAAAPPGGSRPRRRRR